MEVWLEKLTEEDFYKLEVPILFNDKVTSRCFGVFTNGKQSFGLSWRSDLIDPAITSLGSGNYSIGIDQDFSIVNFTNNTIELKISLTYNFFTTSIIEENIFVITELEVIRIHNGTFKILEHYGLPDYFEELVVRGKVLEIRCAENTVIEIAY